MSSPSHQTKQLSSAFPLSLPFTDTANNNHGIASFPRENPSDSRTKQAWKAWLRALASDAEAALGAAFAYQQLDAQGRTAMLNVLEADSANIDVPRIAVYAPLLSVEEDAQRQDRICAAIGADFGTCSITAHAFIGNIANSDIADSDRIIVVLTPMYLEFVKVTTCRIILDQCVKWVRCDPLVHIRSVCNPQIQPESHGLEPIPLNVAIDLIARAIVGQRRIDGRLTDDLIALVQLFDSNGLGCQVSEKPR